LSCHRPVSLSFSTLELSLAGWYDHPTEGD
jgi:hypothetical protein